LGTEYSDIGAFGGYIDRYQTPITIDIPADYPTIQAGIDSSFHGDTILVQPGVYYENLNFKGRNVILASLYISTGDDSYIQSTILDGSDTASVITLNNYEDSPSAIIGFTIRNGNARYGGGIYCSGSTADIAFNLIHSNHASLGGGGIMGPSIQNIYNNTIINNSADDYGGGIYCGNTAVTNNILWGNWASSGPQIRDPNGYNEVTYCDVYGGWEGEGNMFCNPIFCHPDTGNHWVAENSCCIGSGQDGANIGAFGAACPAVSFDYLPGDVNMANGQWPPVVIGSDVTYLVNFFRAIPSSQQCLINNFWWSADANGTCNIIGSDVTYLVNYFRGMAELQFCPDGPPTWQTPDDLPEEAPEGWPNCESE
jgi:predicted outer membrane repeat protein